MYCIHKKYNLLFEINVNEEHNAVAAITGVEYLSCFV